KTLNEAVTQSRRAIQKQADAATQETLKGCRWLLAKNAENLTDTDWIAQVEASGLKALQTFLKTLANWRERILNYFDGRHTNGFAEGVNLKINLIHRRGFGYRNFANFRLHVLVAFDPISH
ncbi:MAG: transposase, partial [Chloroflexi bacterium]|nr:transposase [Chloroflexota bacterium]